jgi:GNAT superfamily N-acetyltransferase
MTNRRVLDWLLAEDQPAIRYRALTELLGRRASDPEVREARRQIPAVGWAAEILAERRPEGWWVDGKSLYTPKYTATNWRMIVLSDLGLSRDVPAVRESCELWMERFALEGGGVGGNSKGKGHHCVVGNMTRALIRLGYVDDRRIRRSLEWLVETAHPNGGWSCFADYWPGRNLDSWEGLSAFAVYPRARWTGPMQRCVERAAEFFLDRELHRQGARYPPWYRTHYPVHYYYDLLVGLDLLTSLGYGDDPRLRFAVNWLARKRRSDGRWNLDAVHPDAGGAVGRWYRAHPSRRPIAWSLERPGSPSKMVTLLALKVQARVSA